MSVSLFSLDEYQQPFARFTANAVQELMLRIDPLLSRIKLVHSDHLPIVQNTMASGEVLEGKPIATEMRFALSFQDITNCDLDSFSTAVVDAAMDVLKQLMPVFFERIGALSKGAGTVVDARGEQLSHDLLLRGYESAELDFDEWGNPILPTLFVGPDQQEALKNLPPRTESQQRAFEEMIERKRSEFNDRRHYRKLSG